MGERQRVMIARALSLDPKLLLADEPTGNLDTQRTRKVLGLLRESAESATWRLLLATHDPQAMAFADRVHELRDGRLGRIIPSRDPVAAEPSSRSLTMARMGLSGIRYIYRARLGARAVLVQEGFAIVGIAVGVALLFASQISSTSLDRLGDSARHAARRRRPGAARGARTGRIRRRAPRTGAGGARGADRAADPRAAGERDRAGGERSVDLIGVDLRLGARGRASVAVASPRSSSPRCRRSRCRNRSPVKSARARWCRIKLQIGARVVRTLLAATLR